MNELETTMTHEELLADGWLALPGRHPATGALIEGPVYIKFEDPENE